MAWKVVGKEMKCEICGKVVERHSYAQRYCKDCSVIVRREQKRVDAIERREGLKLKNSGEKTIKCVRCGVSVECRSPSQMYCPNCALEAAHEQRKKWWKEHYIRKETPKAQKTVKKKEIGLSLAEVDRRARAEGLSYGKYVAKYGL